MSIGEIFIFIFTIIIMIVGIVGIIVPVIPSLPIVWGGVLFYGALTGFEDITVTVIIVTGVLMLLGTVMDAAAGFFGAKIYGASWWGVLGAFVGSIIGMIFSIAGMIVGAFVGACVAEYYVYKNKSDAMKAGVGFFVGFVFGFLIKIFFSFFIIGIFITKIF